MSDYNPSEIHCIEYIGKNPHSNVTILADSLNMTRSGISKLTRKLIDRNTIERYRQPENQKEIYFKLTDKGQEVFDIHENLHKEFEKRDQIVFEETSAEDFKKMLEFTRKYNEHLDQEIEKMGIDIKSGYFDKM